MAHLPSIDLTGELLFLGTGTSVGVPIIGCGCPTCTGSDPRNRRLRCAVAIGLPGGTLLIDTPPDLRTQLLTHGITLVHAVLFTHAHADHLFGLDDLRMFPYYLQRKLPVYCEEFVEGRIRKAYDYIFEQSGEAYYPAALPQLELQRITLEPFELLGARVVPIRLTHGPMGILGFRIGNVAYCTDVNIIPPESMKLLEGLDVLILDALRQQHHPTHFSLPEAVAVAQQLKPRRTLFTHLSHSLEHASTSAELPPGMELAYDGLRVPLSGTVAAS